MATNRCRARRGRGGSPSGARAFRRDSKAKRGSGAGLRFDPDRASHTLDDLFANGKADARAGDLASMQTSERTEDTTMVLLCDPDAVITYLDEPVLFRPFRGDMNVDCGRASKLERIAD